MNFFTFLRELGLLKGDAVRTLLRALLKKLYLWLHVLCVYLLLRVCLSFHRVMGAPPVELFDLPLELKDLSLVVLGLSILVTLHIVKLDVFLRDFLFHFFICCLNIVNLLLKVSVLLFFALELKIQRLDVVFVFLQFLLYLFNLAKLLEEWREFLINFIQLILRCGKLILQLLTLTVEFFWDHYKILDCFSAKLIASGLALRNAVLFWYEIVLVDIQWGVEIWLNIWHLVSAHHGELLWDQTHSGIALSGVWGYVFNGQSAAVKWAHFRALITGVECRCIYFEGAWSLTFSYCIFILKSIKLFVYRSGLNFFLFCVRSVCFWLSAIFTFFVGVWIYSFQPFL